MTVYCVSKPKSGPQGNTYDISPATEYGDIQFLFDAYYNPSANPGEAIDKVRALLKKFNPKTDYIVTAGGDPYGPILVGYILCEMGLPLNYLRFERLRSRVVSSDMPHSQEIVKSGYYIPVVMPNAAY